MADEKSDSSGGLSAVTVAAAAASGLGVIGFVILAGGVVLWRRYGYMGVQADNAVALVPKSVLIAIGADFLVIPLLAASAMVIGLLGVRAVIQGPKHAADAEPPAQQPQGGQHQQPAGQRQPAPRQPDAQQQQAAAPGHQQAAAPGHQQAAAPGHQQAAPPGRQPPAQDAGGEQPHPRIPKWAAAHWIVALLTGLLLLGVTVTAYSSAHFSRFLVLLGLAAAATAVIELAIFHDLPTSALALIAFLALGTYGIAYEYESLTRGSLQVIPMAYERDQPGKATRIEAGYLIAETNDRIVFASLPIDQNNELREFPRTESDDLEIGSLTPAANGKARQKAARFAYNLCKRADALVPAARTTTKKIEPCGPVYLAQLAQAAHLNLPHKPSVSCHAIITHHRVVNRTTTAGATAGRVRRPLGGVRAHPAGPRRIRCAITFANGGLIDGRVVMILEPPGKTRTLGPVRVTAGQATVTARSSRPATRNVMIILTPANHSLQNPTLSVRL
jgi:hypothetical protein